MYNQQRTFGWVIMPHAGTGPVDEGQAALLEQGPRPRQVGALVQSVRPDRDQSRRRWWTRRGRLRCIRAGARDASGPSMCRGQTPMMRRAPLQIDGPGSGGG